MAEKWNPSKGEPYRKLLEAKIEEFGLLAVKGDLENRRFVIVGGSPQFRAFCHDYFRKIDAEEDSGTTVFPVRPRTIGELRPVRWLLRIAGWQIWVIVGSAVVALIVSRYGTTLLDAIEK